MTFPDRDNCHAGAGMGAGSAPGLVIDCTRHLGNWRPRAFARRTLQILAPIAIALANLAQPALAASCERPPEDLRRALAGLWQETPDRVGIAVRRVGCPWTLGWRSDDYFPQQSVSKLWVAITLLDAVDRKRARLDQEVILTKDDLSVFNQTTRYAILERGQIRMTLGQLLRASLSESDNISNGRLLRHIGGPSAVRRFLAARNLAAIRFGPGETALQSAIAGLTWRADYSYGRQFEQARARLPLSTRRAALQAYLENPMDGATPAAITLALSKLAQGQLLSTPTTRHLLNVMVQSRSGPRRLKGGVPSSWKVYHKTGTGQTLGQIDTGYNDVAIIEAPDGTRYAVAVMIAESRRPIAARMAFMQSVSRAIVRHHKPDRRPSRP